MNVKSCDEITYEVEHTWILAGSIMIMIMMSNHWPWTLFQKPGDRDAISSTVSDVDKPSTKKVRLSGLSQSYSITNTGGMSNTSDCFDISQTVKCCARLILKYVQHALVIKYHIENQHLLSGILVTSRILVVWPLWTWVSFQKCRIISWD